MAGFLKKLFKKKSFRVNIDDTKSADRAPYEERHADGLYSLSCVFTIVDRHQENFFIDAYNNLGASMSIVLYAYSNPPEEILKFLGDTNTKKSILMTMCRTEYVSSMLEVASKRFGVSRMAKGIAFSTPITSVAGIAVYKFFADVKKEVRLSKVQKEK